MVDCSGMENEPQKLAYIVPLNRLSHVQAHLDKIIKRATKKGLSTLSYTVGTEPHYRPHSVPFHDPLNPEKEYQVVQVECREVTLSAPTLKLAGWSFVGRIEHLVDEDRKFFNIVYNAPGTTVSPEYRERDPICDHCQVNRYRKDTFIVQHENGTTKQVGSTCLADFLGVDAAAFMAWASLLQSFTSAVSEDFDENCGGGAVRSFPLWAILNVAAATYLDRGYVSRVSAEADGRMATADLIRSYLSAKNDVERNKLIPPAPNKEWVEKGEKLARDTEAWVRDLSEQSFEQLGDYLSNLAVLGKVGHCPYKAIGILGSAVMAFCRNQEKAVQNVENLKSSHQGVIKGKVMVENATVFFVRPFEGYYGNGIIYKFRDPNGNIYVWFSSNKSSDFDVNSVVSFTGTVKAHENDKFLGGAPVTIINRVNTDPDVVAKALNKAKKDEAKAALVN